MLRNSLLRLRIESFCWQVFSRVNHEAYLRRYIASFSDDEGPVQYEIEELQTLESRRWRKRGYKVHVTVDDVPYLGDEKSHWTEGNCGFYIKEEPLRKLKTLVENAEYERKRRKTEGREIVVKWVTAIAAVLAAIGSCANWYLTHNKLK